LGHRRPDRQGFTYSDHSSARLGEESGRRLAAFGRDLERKNIQACDANRHRVGKRAERESGLARCQAVCEKSWHRQTRAARPPANLRPALPSGRRRTRPDSVSTWTCVGANYRAISWLQAADSQRRLMIGSGFGRSVHWFRTANGRVADGSDKIAVYWSRIDQSCQWSWHVA
jgi:hypothetical protein